ncbi:MAG TPA: hypothetical protein VGE74_03710 [Gemmata sp.]
MANHSSSDDLVTTQADLPPGIDAPGPPSNHDRSQTSASLTPEVELDIRRLADRVGGLARLRGLVTDLERAAR